MPDFCENCGSPLGQDANFCSRCGQKVSRASAYGFEDGPEEDYSPVVPAGSGDGDKPRRLLNWLRGTSVEDPEDGFEEDFTGEESFGPEEPAGLEETYGFEDTLGRSDDYIRRWDSALETDVEPEDYYDEEYSIYENHNNFLKKVAVICGAVIGVVLLGFLLVTFLGGRSAGAGGDDGETAALTEAAENFFADFRNLSAEELAEYDGISFERYTGDQETLAEELNILAFYGSAPEITYREVTRAVIEGDAGLVEVEIDGSPEAKDLLGTSQFRRIGDQWKFDFSFFSGRLHGTPPEEGEPGGGETPSTGEEPEEPAASDPEQDEIAISKLIQDFNQAWIRYVNSGDKGVLEYLSPGSVAYQRVSSAASGNLKQELLELKLSNVKAEGDRGSIRAYEKFRKEEGSQTTLVEYTWRYDVVRLNGLWKIENYTKLESSVTEVKPETPEPEEKEPNVIPDSFTRDGSFSGGSGGTGFEISQIRYSGDTNRLVLDFLQEGTNAQSPPTFSVTRTDSGIVLTVTGADKATAAVPQPGSGEPITSVEKPVKTTDGYRIEIRFSGDTAYTAFGLNAGDDRPARIVLDFM